MHFMEKHFIGIFETNTNIQSNLLLQTYTMFLWCFLLCRYVICLVANTYFLCKLHSFTNNDKHHICFVFQCYFENTKRCYIWAIKFKVRVPFLIVPIHIEISKCNNSSIPLNTLEYISSIKRKEKSWTLSFSIKSNLTYIAFRKQISTYKNGWNIWCWEWAFKETI